MKTFFPGHGTIWFPCVFVRCFFVMSGSVTKRSPGFFAAKKCSWKLRDVYDLWRQDETLSLDKHGELRYQQDNFTRWWLNLTNVFQMDWSHQLWERNYTDEDREGSSFLWLHEMVHIVAIFLVGLLFILAIFLAICCCPLPSVQGGKAGVDQVAEWLISGWSKWWVSLCGCFLK